MAAYTDQPPNFFDKSILMGAIPFPPPLRPPVPPPDDTTHRFYQCIEVPAKKNVITCTKVLKGTPLTTSESVTVTIKKGCPQTYDPLVLSWKTGAAVMIQPN
jgi:hypothetical protein